MYYEKGRERIGRETMYIPPPQLISNPPPIQYGMTIL